jgi:hypothetical protein
MDTKFTIGEINSGVLFNAQLADWLTTKYCVFHSNWKRGF